MTNEESLDATDGFRGDNFSAPICCLELNSKMTDNFAKKNDKENQKIVSNNNFH